MGIIEREYMNNKNSKQKNRDNTYFREEHVDYVLPALKNLKVIGADEGIKPIIKKCVEWTRK